MDTRLEDSHAYNIIEPWTTDDNDIAHHLHNLGVKFTMRGTSIQDYGIDDVIIYTAYITHEDALHIKLVFPKVSVRLCVVKEKVSTLVRRVCENIIV